MGGIVIIIMNMNGNVQFGAPVSIQAAQVYVPGIQAGQVPQVEGDLL